MEGLMLHLGTRTRLCLVLTLAGLAGCGAEASAGERDLDRCALLTSAEVVEAIGPHDGGSTDIGNQWGLMSCRWTATVAQEGWYDAIEVGVFEGAMVQLARDDAEGEPVVGFVPGALYDPSAGELWFDCAGGRFCVVKARTMRSGGREEVATRLARLVESRLR
jgi:hypothetical protein